MTEVDFPPLSKDEPGSVGVVSRWYVRDGEHVVADQLIAEVQVDKVAADVVAPESGTVTLVVPEETEVAQGTVIATIG